MTVHPTGTTGASRPIAGITMRSGGALAGGGLAGVGVSVGEGVSAGVEACTELSRSVGAEAGGAVAVGVGDMALGVGKNAAVGVVVAATVGGKGVEVGGMSVAVIVLLPP